jgi:hypothetical protein
LREQRRVGVGGGEKQVGVRVEQRFQLGGALQCGFDEQRMVDGAGVEEVTKVVAATVLCLM